MSNSINVINKLIANIQETYNEKNPEGSLLIDKNTPLFESKILNSYLMLELVDFIEIEFDVELSEEDLSAENFESVGKLASIIKFECT